ncbi:Cytidylyltransferase [uncultured virus]|nr:Cytidylyltransferase [uncultured virus]
MSKIKVGFYVGSFDPFHIGHLEVAQVALRYVDKVIIVPNNPNRKKAHRTNLHHRVQIIQLSIRDVCHQDRIEVSDEDVNSLNQHFYEDYHLVGLLGSDQCIKEPKFKVHEWLIVPRNGIKPPISWQIKCQEGLCPSWSVPVAYLPSDLFQHQQWSSTYVRQQITSINEHKENKERESKDIMDSLLKHKIIPDSVLSYIQKHNLYTIESQIRKRYPDGQLRKIKDNVTLVDDRVIVKYYPDKESFEHERSSFEIAKNLSLPIPEYLFDCDDLMIGMSYCGKSIKEALNECSGYKIGCQVGILLKNLHTLDIKPGQIPDIVLKNRKIRNIIESGLLDSKKKDPTLLDLNLESCKATFTNPLRVQLRIKDPQSGTLKGPRLSCTSQLNYNLVEKYSNNPGSLGYCHGDASINNFTILGDTVTMIDFSGLSKMGSLGIPAYEYYQFICSVNSLVLIDEKKMKELKDGFIDGYGETGFTPEADALFQTYWNRMFIRAQLI